MKIASCSQACAWSLSAQRLSRTSALRRGLAATSRQEACSLQRNPLLSPYFSQVPQLWVVAPRCDPRGADVQRVAISTLITDRMVVVGSLEEALADTTGSVGFTRRAGSTRFTHASIGDMLHLFPDAIPQLLPSPFLRPGSSSEAGASGVTALVFGREESGLTESELRLVSHACAIPSGRVQPSLNLSHAVSVVLSDVS